ncbi:unnamed protein product [Mycena citricolor]|uniref:Peptidase C14 caspase domain-containing protein n=1 Tax=Mycena citricolor TaxID=2018698 RepID=A0AAD2Q2G0_9AGAR|nr:unnamed protein product [Mycena citricolor]
MTHRRNSPPAEYKYEPSPHTLLSVPVYEHCHNRSSQRQHSHSHLQSHSHHNHSRPHTPALRPAQIVISAPPPQHQVLRKLHKQQQPVHLFVSKSHARAPAAVPVPVPSVPLMPPIHPNFMYSRCTGRRKALCIGINYFGSPQELRGCINDAKNVFHFLVRHASYRPEDIVVLTDDARDNCSLPTRRNMIDAMHWLIKDAKPHDALFFHYSGHGGQTKDLDGDEVDGYDEVISPMDFQQAGQIVDDVPLLPLFVFQLVLTKSRSLIVSHLQYDSHGQLSHVSPCALSRKAAPADVISLSGCEDGKTSVETFMNGQAVGAASHAFIEAVLSNPQQSYQQLLQNVRVLLKPNFTQKPQLGSSHPIDTSLRFIM